MPRKGGHTLQSTPISTSLPLVSDAPGYSMALDPLLAVAHHIYDKVGGSDHNSFALVALPFFALLCLALLVKAHLLPRPQDTSPQYV